MLERYPGLGSYYGVEQIPELLDEAISRYGDMDATSFIPGNFMYTTLPHVDIVMACGSLNYTSSNPKFIFKLF